MNLPAFTTMMDLTAERLGGKALLCSDDFFAEKENLLKPGRGVFIPDKYTDRGKWMDGWESRRKRGPGYDWCIIQLAAPGQIHGVDIDTNHFVGNHPPFASVDAFNIKDTTSDDIDKMPWMEILSKSPLQPGSRNIYAVEDKNIYTHLRLNIYPDGGVARLKVYGEIMKDWSATGSDEEVDLAAVVNGARAVLCNDMFFSHMDNLIMPGRAAGMADGWETKRNRDPSNKDWVIVQLAHPGSIHRAIIDTGYFKGNYPDSCMIEGCRIEPGKKIDFVNDQIDWEVILSPVKLEADKEHQFEEEIAGTQWFTHIRLVIFPDGGISRMRLFGKPFNP